MFNKLKQVKDLRSQAKTLQNSLSTESVTAEVKNCSMTMDGNQKITNLHIDPKYLEPKQKEALEKIIISLQEESQKKVQKIMMGKMREQGGFDNFPGLS